MTAPFPSNCFTESQNHWGWRGLWRCSSPTSCPSRVIWRWLPRAVSSWILSMSKDEGFTTYLGNLFHCWITCVVKVFSYIQTEFPEFQFVSIASCLSGHPWEDAGSASFVPPIGYLETHWEDPLSHLFSRLNTPPLSAFPCITDGPVPSSPLWPFAGLTPVCPQLSGVGSPALVSVIQMCLTSPKQRGRITSSNLLATLFLTQLENKTVLYSWVWGEQAKQHTAGILGTWLDIAGPVFSKESESFFSINTRSSAAPVYPLLGRDSQSYICLHLVPLNIEHLPKRPKGNREEGKEEAGGKGAVVGTVWGWFEIVKQQTSFRRS